jgi:hypothetical protein
LLRITNILGDSSGHQEVLPMAPLCAAPEMAGFGGVQGYPSPPPPADAEGHGP